MSDAITPFKIAIDDAQLDDLKRRLARHALAGQRNAERLVAGHSARLRAGRLCSYWEKDYDWRAREALLNRFPQFRTTIDGVGIHFIHVRSPHAEALPLVMTHGWPGSIVEFQKVIEPLTNPTKHGGTRSGCVPRRVSVAAGLRLLRQTDDDGLERREDRPRVERADAATRLSEVRRARRRLGRDRHDGDRLNDTANCLGIHLNMPIVTPDPATMNDLTDREKSALAGMQHYADWDSGYSKQQSTRPQTLGYGLADSPSGQAAWIVEKFWSWMDCDGHPENVVIARRAARQRDAVLAARTPLRRRRGCTGRASTKSAAIR